MEYGNVNVKVLAKSILQGKIKSILQGKIKSILQGKIQ
jgi:molybdopterin-binding protein